MASVPIRFISFTISFLADGKLVDTQQIEYGEDTARIEYPEIPPKEGYFGTWQTVENETVSLPLHWTKANLSVRQLCI